MVVRLNVVAFVAESIETDKSVFAVLPAARSAALPSPASAWAARKWKPSPRKAAPGESATSTWITAPASGPTTPLPAARRRRTQFLIGRLATILLALGHDHRAIYIEIFIFGGSRSISTLVVEEQSLEVREISRAQVGRPSISRGVLPTCDHPAATDDGFFGVERFVDDGSIRCTRIRVIEVYRGRQEVSTAAQRHHNGRVPLLSIANRASRAIKRSERPVGLVRVWGIERSAPGVLSFRRNVKVGGATLCCRGYQ